MVSGPSLNLFHRLTLARLFGGQPDAAHDGRDTNPSGLFYKVTENNDEDAESETEQEFELNKSQKALSGLAMEDFGYPTRTTEPQYPLRNNGLLTSSPRIDSIRSDLGRFVVDDPTIGSRESNFAAN